MHSPIVSVLMTAYNREKYIAAAIESVLASSFRDFELIIVDDCSKDRSHEIGVGFAKRDSRVRVYRNEKNLGDYPNRNQAAHYAQGKYLKYVDSDDIIYPHGLQVMVDCIESFPEAALGLCRPPDTGGAFPICLSPRQAYEKHFFDAGLFSNAPLSAMIHRDRFAEAEGFSGRRYIGDTELWLKLAGQFPVVLMPMGLTWWRPHGEQEFSYGQQNHSYAELSFSMTEAALSVETCPLTSEQRAIALHHARVVHFLHLLVLARHGHCRKAWQLFRSARLDPRLIVSALCRILHRKK